MSQHARPPPPPPGSAPGPAATSLRSRKTAIPPTGGAGRTAHAGGSGSGRSRSRSQDVLPPRRSSRVSRRTGNEDMPGFAVFLGKLVKVCLLPITIPSRISYNLLTSPTTISTTIKLVLFTTLLVLSAGFTAVALAGFWYAGVGRSGGVVDLEGWFVYGSKTFPTPHAYIPLPASSEKLFMQGVGYDVDVTMELVRPRSVDAEEAGNFMLGVDFYSQATGAVVASVSQPCLPAQPYTPPSIPSRIINVVTAPALYALRLPFAFSPTSLLFNPLNLIRSSASRQNNRRKLKSGKETFILTRPIISSFSQNAYTTTTSVQRRRGGGGGETFEGKGLVMRPDGRGKAGTTIGAVQVTVGREDAASLGSGRGKGEVKTTGWVVVSFTPRPTGIRYIFAAHPMIPLLIIPPIAFFMTLSSATFGYFIISLFFSSARPVRAKQQRQPPKSIGDDGPLPRATTGAGSRSGIQLPDTAGAVPEDSLPRAANAHPASKEGVRLTSNVLPPREPIAPGLDRTTAQAAETQQQHQQQRARGKVPEEKTSSGAGTTSGSVTSSTTGEDGSESGTVTH